VRSEGARPPPPNPDYSPGSAHDRAPSKKIQVIRELMHGLVRLAGYEHKQNSNQAEHTLYARTGVQLPPQSPR